MLTSLLKKIRYNLLFYYYQYKTPDETLFDGVSRYSHIRVKREGSKQRLIFVKQVENGQLEYTESEQDLLDPLHLPITYTRLIFSSLFFFPSLASIDRILMIGLGGGVFCPFIKEYLPHATVDIVEVDEMVADLARRYFEFKESSKTNLYIDDIRNYIGKTDKRYDLILSDPYILGGVPIHLRTVEYYRMIKEIMNDRGVFSANVVLEDKFLASEIKAVTSLFPSMYFFTGNSGNGAMIAYNSPEIKHNKDDIIKAAQRLEREYRFSFRLVDLAHGMNETFSRSDSAVLSDRGIPPE